MEILVVGPGCPRCITTEKNVITAVKELNINAEVKHVYDIREYSKLGVMLTPAVLIDGKVVAAGRIPTVDEIKNILMKIKNI